MLSACTLLGAGGEWDLLRHPLALGARSYPPRCSFTCTLILAGAAAAPQLSQISLIASHTHPTCVLCVHYRGNLYRGPHVPLNDCRVTVAFDRMLLAITTMVTPVIFIVVLNTQARP
jgi:hypothetical protein